MRISYYGYTISDGQNKLLCPVKDLLRGFCEYNNPEFKKNICIDCENYYLLPVGNNIFLFLKTSDKSIIKKIDTTDTTIQDISSILNISDEIGFSSYVYIGDSYIGFASRSMSPKVLSFPKFMNFLLQRVIRPSDTLTFNLHALTSYITRQDAMKFKHIGRSTLSIGRANSTFEKIQNSLNWTQNDIYDLDEIEIIIKPRRGKNIAPAVKKLIEGTDNNDLVKMQLKASNELHEALSECFIFGSGVINDIISGNSDYELIQKISKLQEQKSPQLKQEIEAFTNNVEHEKHPNYMAEIIDSFLASDSWDSAANNLLGLKNH